ncbi:MAG: AbrB/MazE/SpoVT family DNA-binding domain-containing protein [Oscillospiraceae bacterium]|nr:AbrB/MazE/SpoVT family DNA-binding domain-containing protein [Oscillospiraceae bacterium]
MKATGIVRRIDDLGRVVIPKEIRRTLRIRDGDPLEIYTEKDGEVIFKKYSPMGELGDNAAAMCETLGRAAGSPVAITDRDSVIAVSGVPKRELLSKPLSSDLESIMELRRLYRRKSGESGLRLSDAAEKYVVNISAPILTEGELMGSVIFFTGGDDSAGDIEEKLAQTVAGFLGKQMEA